MQIFCLGWNCSGNYLASGSQDQTIKIWKVGSRNTTVGCRVITTCAEDLSKKFFFKFRVSWQSVSNLCIKTCSFHWKLTWEDMATLSCTYDGILIMRINSRPYLDQRIKWRFGMSGLERARPCSALLVKIFTWLGILTEIPWWLAIEMTLLALSTLENWLLCQNMRINTKWMSLHSYARMM